MHYQILNSAPWSATQIETFKRCKVSNNQKTITVDEAICLSRDNSLYFEPSVSINAANFFFKDWEKLRSKLRDRFCEEARDIPLFQLLDTWDRTYLCSDATFGHSVKGFLFEDCRCEIDSMSDDLDVVFELSTSDITKSRWSQVVSGARPRLGSCSSSAFKWLSGSPACPDVMQRSQHYCVERLVFSNSDLACVVSDVLPMELVNEGNNRKLIESLIESCIVRSPETTKIDIEGIVLILGAYLIAPILVEWNRLFCTTSIRCDPECLSAIVRYFSSFGLNNRDIDWFALGQWRTVLKTVGIPESLIHLTADGQKLSIAPLSPEQTLAARLILPPDRILRAFTLDVSELDSELALLA